MQASQDCEKILKDRMATLQQLHKEQDVLCNLEKRYHTLTGGRNFPKSTSSMKEVKFLNRNRFTSTNLTLFMWMVLLIAPVPPLLTTPPLSSSHAELSRNAMPPINLERWYQDIMAAGGPQSCPPPLPAKSFSTRRHGQVNSLTHENLLSCS
ncbi:hypothetical protein XENOCAPTIV_008112 [Xenoophorus captivus]|uniref:Uncharacterized protein n=1 Tax=Xenoophorus captivus TaxID=1517983 RepID=A0ABV0RVI8_9TELE